MEKASLELRFYEDIFGVKFKEVEGSPGGEVYKLMIEGEEDKCLIERIKLQQITSERMTGDYFI